MDTLFLAVADQSTVEHYWGFMRFLGRMDTDTAMYAVDFKPEAEHCWHYHEQDELIVVAQGRIEQKIGPRRGCADEARLLTEADSRPGRELRAGDAVHLPRDHWHSALPLEHGTQVVFTIKGGNGLYRAYEKSGANLDGPPVPQSYPERCHTTSAPR